jgi:membrane protein implicated in regulation of membrane protease activity
MNHSFYWIITAFILIIVETIFPLAYFLWFGISCLILSGITYFFTPIDVWQVIIYTIITPFVVVLGRRFVPIHINNRYEKNINKKMNSLIGKEIILTEDINDKLQVKIDETYWTLTGKNLKKGMTVHVKSIDNNRLIVEEIKK